MSRSDLSSKQPRDVCDALFTKLFSKKENVLELYKALHPDDAGAGLEDVRIIHPSVPIFPVGHYNELCFLARGKLVAFLESKGAWCPNIALILLGFYGTFLEEHLGGDFLDEDALSPAGLQIPMPEGWVLCTGEGPEDGARVSTSDNFGPGASIEFRIKVLRSGRPGTILAEYVEFSRVYAENLKAFGNDARRAAEETILAGLERGLFGGFLREHAEELTALA